MNSNIRLLIFLVVFLSSCQKRDWNNPFDPECPKELFTPTNFKAVQEGKTIKLSWEQPVNTISRFELTKQVNGGQEASLPEQNKDKLQYVDPSVLVGGKLIVYKLIASAGSNESNPVVVMITPITNPPSVSTTTVNNLTTSTATSGGDVTNDGAAAIIARGVCWSASPNPTVANSKTSEAIGTGTGSFTSSLTGLSNNIKYYVRAYATNAVGTSYGSESSFTLYLNVPDSPVSDIDGNVYKTVKIGNQIWMAENLKVTKYRNGNTIPNVTDYTSWANLTSGAYSDFFNDPNIGVIYGHLYNFYTVLDNRQLCPTGWHIPSDAEFTTLTNFLGGESVAGGKLKEVGTNHWNSSNIGADNISGFTGLAGGWRGDIGSFYYSVGTTGNWWSSTEYDANNGIYRGLAYNNTIFSRSYGAYFGKKGGCSIRCIKD